MEPIKIKVPLQLEGRTLDGDPWVIPIEGSPFVIGRGEGVQLRLAAPGVSRQHASIRETPQGWFISDCGSTNGTYVNGTRLSGEHLLRTQDLIRIAGMQFTILELTGLAESTQIINPYAVRFELMMHERAVVALCQPVVSMTDRSRFGYEMLGRTFFPGLPSGPKELLAIAKGLGREVELCVLFREVFLEQVAAKSIGGIVLFNVHPKEMTLDKIEKTLVLMRTGAPHLGLGMELHENTVTDPALMSELKRILKDLDIRLVYDDFGAGQARLIELLDSTPDILKFDLALIRNIHLRPDTSRSIVGALVRMAKDAGIQTLAEGIESAEEAEVCRALGFDLAQGFYFGQPAPL